MEEHTEADEVVAAITAGDTIAASSTSGAEKKKKKKKKNKKPSSSSSSSSQTTAALELLSDRKMLDRFANLDLSSELKEARSSHPFWTSQPIVSMKVSVQRKIGQNVNN